MAGHDRFEGSFRWSGKLKMPPCLYGEPAIRDLLCNKHSRLSQNRGFSVKLSRVRFAGQFAEDLSDLTEIGAELGGVLGARAIAALGISPSDAESYGKAALVGVDGELEHAVAILHPKLGALLRATVEKGAALVPSSKKRGGPGRMFDIPLGHKDAAYVCSHFDSMEESLSDALRAEEILVAIAVTDSGRPLPRVGGLTAAEAEGKDGLR